MEITKLRGIGAETAKKFEKHGITHVEQIFVIPPPQIAEILGIDNDSANNLFAKARELYYKDSKNGKKWQKASKVKEDDKDIERITTGTRALDKLFTGGISCNDTTEVYGEFGCGKTQFCFTMAVRAQLPKEKGGLEGKVIWIDTEGTFKPNRIVDIATTLDLDPDKVLENIIVARAFNSVDQKIILNEAEQLIINDDNIKLLIVDSAIGLFRQDFSGRAMLSERQKYLDQFLTMCSNMAAFHKIAVIWTNQVMINPGIFYGDPVTVVGGTILAHKSTYRVYFKKAGKFRIAKMVDSSEHPQMEQTFGLSKSGVVDKDVIEEQEKQRKKTLTSAKKEEKLEE